MYDHSRFLRTVSQFSGRLVTSYDVDAVLTDAMSGMVDVFGLECAGMALAEQGELRSAVEFPAEVGALETVQNRLQAGPCVEAFRSGQALAVADLEEYADRWPEYCAAARAQGLGAVLALPLRLGEQAVGAVDLYAKGTRVWPDEDVVAAVVLADMVTAYLINASTLRQQEQLAEQLQHALDSRTVIEQAKGVVSARRGVPVDEAFELIRRHARNHQVTVRAVAEGVVALGLEV